MRKPTRPCADGARTTQPPPPRNLSPRNRRWAGRPWGAQWPRTPPTHNTHTPAATSTSPLWKTRAVALRGERQEFRQFFIVKPFATSKTELADLLLDEALTRMWTRRAGRRSSVTHRPRETKMKTGDVLPWGHRSHLGATFDSSGDARRRNVISLPEAWLQAISKVVPKGSLHPKGLLLGDLSPCSPCSPRSPWLLETKAPHLLVPAVVKYCPGIIACDPGLKSPEIVYE